MIKLKSNHFLLKQSNHQSIMSFIYSKTSKYFQYFIYHFWNQTIQRLLYKRLFIMKYKKMNIKSRIFQTKKIKKILWNEKNISFRKTHESIREILRIVKQNFECIIKKWHRNKESLVYKIKKHDLFESNINQKINFLINKFFFISF